MQKKNKIKFINKLETMLAKFQVNNNIKQFIKCFETKK